MDVLCTNCKIPRFGLNFVLILLVDPLIRVNDFRPRGLPLVVCTIPDASGYKHIIFPITVGDMRAVWLGGD